MKEKSIIQIPSDSLEKLISLMPFYKEIKQQDKWQYDLLLQHSKVITYQSRETVLEEGARDEWLCFLLKGELDVLAGEQNQVVNHIVPGEVFGDLALVFKQQRSATVAVSRQCREAVVFLTDFSLFGDLTNLRRVSLMTKLVYYRNLLLSLRWKLEVYRSSHPEHELANQHRKVKLYVGAKDTLEELVSLDSQAKQLGGLLLKWNVQFGHIANNSANKDNLNLDELSSISL